MTPLLLANRLLLNNYLCFRDAGFYKKERHLRTLCTKILLLVCLAVCGFSTLTQGEPHFEKLLSIAREKYGSQGLKRTQAWRDMMQASAPLNEAAKLLAVNNFFNQQIRFASDTKIWEQLDYWATPLETIGVGAGDCEDFSIAKYISLLKLNISVDKLRLIYVKANTGANRAQAHMVLAYYSSNNTDPLVLDNISPIILNASKRKDLTPVFSFNSKGLWLGNETKPKITQPETRLSRWRDVLLRMQLEGI